MNCPAHSFILILILFISNYGNVTQMGRAQDDRECLNAFKNSVSDPQGYLRDWNFLNQSRNVSSLTVCGWTGVTCSKINKVVSLSLHGAGLHSESPWSLGLAQCVSLLQLDLSHNSFHGPIPADLCTQMPYLTQLDMSHNQLVGSIPHGLGDCLSLTDLRLDNNLLSGEIPWQLGTLPTLSKLDLSHNHLSGAIPSSFGASANRSFPASAFANNPHLCGPLLHSNLCVELADSPRHSRAAKNLLKVIGTTMLALLIIVAVLAGARYCWHKGVLLHQRSTNTRGNLQPIIFQGDPINLTWEELRIATKGFSQANIVGSGGSSTVYKGNLKDGRKIAVKLMMRDELGLAHYTPKELFLTELKVLGKLRHRNIVRILGHSFDNDEGNMAIILDYIPMGSLDTLLHRSAVLCEDQLPWCSPSHSARWKTRINILLGIAEGLAYLHNDYDYKVCVIHGDLKPSNVLLDQNLEAHIADFGLARIVGAINVISGTSSWGRVVSRPCWSVGYTAPECVQQGVVSRKGDVFSFGMIVLEVITGKRPIEYNSWLNIEEGESLVEWVSKALADGEVERVVAPALLRLASCNQAQEVTWLREDLKSMLKMGCQCASMARAARPNMHEVVALLRQLRDKAVSVELERGFIQISQTRWKFVAQR